MIEFTDFIEDRNLIDLQFKDRPYTGFNGDSQLIASRIDRILVSEEWDEKFSNINQALQQKLLSDHSPRWFLGANQILNLRIDGWALMAL